jgi:hypothetical protein
MNVANLMGKRQDKTVYNKLYTARVTKRIFDLLKERMIKGPHGDKFNPLQNQAKLD